MSRHPARHKLIRTFGFVALSVLMTGAYTPPARAENIVFPPGNLVVNVREQYGAKGDGVTDDTDALQRAIFENKGKLKTLYFPKGTYLVSRTLFVGGTRYSTEPVRSKAHSSDRFLSFQGQSEQGTTIRLRDRCTGFDDPATPRDVLSMYDGEGTGDAMHSYVRNLSVDVGAGNPGAAGLRFLSNNTGAMYHVTIKSSDPAGAGSIGLDLRQGQQGPELIRDVTIDGFDIGVQTDDTFAIVFERLTLNHQNKCGFVNPSGSVTIRGLKSDNRVNVIKSGGNPLTIVEADLRGGVETETAVVTTGRKNYIRDATQAGYGAIVDDGQTKVTGVALEEWVDGAPKALFPADGKSLRLPIKETPEVPWEQDFSKWLVLDDSQPDDTALIQKQIDDAAKTGVTTLVFKPGEHKYKLSAPVRVHGSVTRVLGMECTIDVIDPTGAFKNGTPIFTFEDLQGDVVVAERFFIVGGWDGPRTVPTFCNKSGKTVVIQSMGLCGSVKGVEPGGEWFIDDVSPGRDATLRIGPGEKVWARQLNPESYKADMIDVAGGQLWLLGLKTEGRATHIVATDGARVELLGGLSYQSWDKQPIDPPMFRIADSDVSLTFGVWSSRFPFSTIVEEIRGGRIKTLKPAEMSNWHLGLYRSTH